MRGQEDGQSKTLLWVPYLKTHMKAFQSRMNHCTCCTTWFIRESISKKANCLPKY